MIVRYRNYIVKDTRKQCIAVRGRDKFNRAIAMKFQRTEPMNATDNDEVLAYRITQIFLTEKTNAVTEILSYGFIDNSITILDYTNYKSSNLPPYTIFCDVILMLQSHYPERAYRIILSDPPFFLRTGYYMLRPFIATATQEKILMVSGVDAKQQTFGNLIDTKQAMTYLLPNGHLTTPIDIDKVLNQPFHALYDDNDDE
jgi:CRAL/TRIO domain